MMQMQMQMHVQGKSFSIGSCMELAPTRVQATGFTCRNTGEMWKKGSSTEGRKQKEHGTEKPRPASAEWPARTVGLSVHVYGRKGRAFGNYVTRTQRNLLLQVSVFEVGPEMA